MFQITEDKRLLPCLALLSPITSMNQTLPPLVALPVSIDTDVNLITLAEHWFGEVKGLEDFLVVSIENNLGLGIMHNGELFRGANGLSRERSDAR